MCGTTAARETDRRRSRWWWSRENILSGSVISVEQVHKWYAVSINWEVRKAIRIIVHRVQLDNYPKVQHTKCSTYYKFQYIKYRQRIFGNQNFSHLIEKCCQHWLVLGYKWNAHKNRPLMHVTTGMPIYDQLCFTKWAAIVIIRSKMCNSKKYFKNYRTLSKSWHRIIVRLCCLNGQFFMCIIHRLHYISREMTVVLHQALATMSQTSVITYQSQMCLQLADICLTQQTPKHDSTITNYNNLRKGCVFYWISFRISSKSRSTIIHEKTIRHLSIIHSGP